MKRNERTHHHAGGGSKYLGRAIVTYRPLLPGKGDATCPHCRHVRDELAVCCGCGDQVRASELPRHPQHAQGCARTWQPAALCDCGGYKAKKKR